MKKSGINSVLLIMCSSSPGCVPVAALPAPDWYSGQRARVCNGWGTPILADGYFVVGHVTPFGGPHEGDYAADLVEVRSGECILPDHWKIRSWWVGFDPYRDRWKIAEHKTIIFGEAFLPGWSCDHFSQSGDGSFKSHEVLLSERDPRAAIDRWKGSFARVVDTGDALLKSGNCRLVICSEDYQRLRTFVEAELSRLQEIDKRRALETRPD